MLIGLGLQRKTVEDLEVYWVDLCTVLCNRIGFFVSERVGATCTAIAWSF